MGGGSLICKHYEASGHSLLEEGNFMSLWVLNKIINDNGPNLNKKMMKELCKDFKFEHHNSSPYRPKMNGVVEATNKNIKKNRSKYGRDVQGMA